MLYFLRQVAKHISASGKDLSNTSIVFPNRRSALFFNSCLHELTKDTAFMPRMMSISYFTQQFCDTVLADETQLVMILYKVYCRVLTAHGREEQIPDFDSFCFWGRILLKDFSDVDAYLCDHKDLFRNIKAVREISANYLTDDQKEVMAILWGHQSVPANSDDFWNHIPHNGAPDSPAARFINLWELLGELYEGFTDELAKGRIPLAYSGLQSRKACERIMDMGKDDFHGRRFIFIGFNVLSTARIKIMKRLRDLGIAEFYFDNSPALLRGAKAGAMIDKLVEMFPMPEGFSLDPGPEKQDIEIISCPSSVAQAKAMGKEIEALKESWTGCSDEEVSRRLLGTSVVFANESLLMPALYSLPESISQINITMGLPFSATPFAGLMSSLISMHIRSHSSQGNTQYFYKDVTDLLMHPYINLIAGEEATRISKEIFDLRLYNVDAAWLIENFKSLDFIFTPIVDQTDISSIKSYISILITKFTEVFRLKAGDKEKEYYELTILDGYRKAVDDICKYVEQYGIRMHEHTFLQMIERTVASGRLNFTGEPLKGLQFMGIMDTRCLDFDNVILMSMNEKVFPRRNYNPSLIPATLRAAYMLPTQEHEEASYAYQFLRLVSRASRVRLLFDSRANGSAGEMSRYLSQLIYLHPELNIKVTNLTMENIVVKPERIVINKTQEVQAELQEFYEGGHKRLSASALKTYMLCPLQFYLQYVRGIRVDEAHMDFIDASSYGTAIHAVAQELYNERKEELITPQVIEDMLRREELHGDIERRALKALDHFYYRDRYATQLNKMPGEGQVTAKIITKYIVEMLKHEKDYKPFKFVGAEVGDGDTFKWKINDKYCLNFTMSIDRIDRIAEGATNDEEYLRFIDYKTGSDSLSASDLDTIFSNHKKGGIFQLLLYCHAYARNGFKGKIQPIIYQFVTMAKNGITPLSFGKNKLLDYRQVDNGEDTFYKRFENLIDKIFEKENKYPFDQTPKEDDCLFCPFAQLCDRYPEKKY